MFVPRYGMMLFDYYQNHLTITKLIPFSSTKCKNSNRALIYSVVNLPCLKQFAQIATFTFNLMQTNIILLTVQFDTLCIFHSPKKQGKSRVYFTMFYVISIQHLMIGTCILYKF